MSKVLPILNLEFRKKESDARLEPNTAWERRVFDPPLADNVGCSKPMAQGNRVLPNHIRNPNHRGPTPARVLCKIDAEINSGWLLGL